MKSLNRLMMVGLVGLGGCLGMYGTFRYTVSNQIKQTNVYNEAMDLLKDHKGARYLLGEPIKDFKAKFNSPGEYFGKQTEVKVPVSGPKSTGILFFTLTGGEGEVKKLDTVQLQIGKDNTKRLVIKKPIEVAQSAS